MKNGNLSLFDVEKDVNCQVDLVNEVEMSEYEVPTGLA